ncbi:MAG: zinc-binding dehydrogenase [Spirochaetes bacterium]|nr:zinc-binding dehydrogenase [Spirochaetota bacterium]
MGNNSIPKTMKALVLPEPGKFEVREVAVPEPADGEVLCRIRAVAICGSDPEIIRGDLAGFWPPFYPFIPGHEWAGEVVALGKGVHTFKVGDRVAGQAHKGCGYCRRCMEGSYNICENYGKPETGHRHYGFTHNGAYAQFNAYSIRSLTLLPSHISFKEGALVDTSGVVMHGMELTGITAGGTVVVIGPGPIGLIAMRMAKALGASKVIAVGRRDRLKVAKELCADEAVDFEKTNPIEAVKALTNGLGADEVFECSGAAGTMLQAVYMVRRGGKVGLLGVPEGKVADPIPTRYVVSNEISIYGSKANPNVSPKIVNLVATGNLKLKDLVSHTFPLEQFAEALDTFVSRKGCALKVVLEPNGKE